MCQGFAQPDNRLANGLGGNQIINSGQGMMSGQNPAAPYGAQRGGQPFAPRMMDTSRPFMSGEFTGGFGQQPQIGRIRPHSFNPQGQPPQGPQIPQNSIANMFGPQGGQVQSFFDSIRKYAPGQQQAPQTPNPAFNPQGKGLIVAEDSQPQYSPAPWTPASTPNYLHPPTAAYMYGADPWKRTDPRQVWSGGANGQWGLQPGYNGYTG